QSGVVNGFLAIFPKMEQKRNLLDWAALVEKNMHTARFVGEPNVTQNFSFVSLSRSGHEYGRGSNVRLGRARIRRSAAAQHRRSMPSMQCRQVGGQRDVL